jgi:tetratricopeptide (TPR) repeat protein/predicted Ser/Thr protein kinase
MAGNRDVLGLLEEMLDSGKTPEEVCRDCPELLAEVRRRWQQFRRIDAEVGALLPEYGMPPGAGASTPAPETGVLPQVPGYAVEAVLGRGGMGVVYKARHLRLNRPVALKMLLAGAYAAPQERARFQREAEAVAGLRHANIVQVYDVGDHEGRPYFTMECVEGGSLARKAAGTPQPACEAAALVATLAEAIEVAHQGGIVHRDLTPANILLTADGTPKIVDFGLARRMEGDGGLTVTGVPVGTPNYMAPEQVRGDREAIGPATDVYALGGILYEMLTGRPPFRAGTAAATLQQVLAEDTVPPSRVNRGVPRDLETICLKCLHKEPRRRYATAAALAEDLQRFLRREPIAARRAGRLERVAKWVRRRPALATSLVASLLLAAAVLAGAGRWIGQRTRTVRAVEAELTEVARLGQQSDFPEARAALERAQARLGDNGPDWMRPLVAQARRDLDLLERLEAVRLNRSAFVVGRVDHAAEVRLTNAQAARDYEEAFRDAGLDEPPNDPDATAARVRASIMRVRLVAALDDWAACSPDPARQAWLLRVARGADPDAWRDRVRDPAAWGDGATLRELARTAPVAEQPISLLLALGERLQAVGGDGVWLLRRVQAEHPDDFWTNFTLARMLHGTESQEQADPPPAVVYYQKALELRPHAAAVRNNLGVILFDRNRLWDNAQDWGPGAVTVFRQAVESDPGFAPALNNLGLALKHKGNWPEARRAYEAALRINPHLAVAHLNLGEILAGSWHLDEGMDQYRQALRIDPGFARAHYYLGIALAAKGWFDEVDDIYPKGVESLKSGRHLALGEANDRYWQACNFNPAWAPARNMLRIPHQVEAQLNEATDHYQQAIRSEPSLAVAHGALGQALLARRDFAKAEAATRRSLDLLRPGEENLRANLERQRQRCRHLLLLEGRVPAIVQGKDKPAAAECLDAAELCFVGHHYATAARLYAEALAATPRLTEDLRAGHRLNAARAAALAGCRRGDDVAGLGEPELTALRKQARTWLQLDRDAWDKKVDAGTATDRIEAQKALASWRDDPDLAGLRDPEWEKLPPAERQECRALWETVGLLLERAKGAALKPR